MVDLIAAATARERAGTGATHEDQAWSHRGWIKYLESIASPATPSSTDSTDANKTSSSAPLQQQSEKEDFQGMLSKSWLLEQSEIPFQVYAQPSGSMDNPTHSKTKTFNRASFYNDNTDPTSTMTPKRNSKKPSPSASLPQLQNKRTQNYNEPSDSLLPSPFSLPCNHAST
jgi:hypothetical protein